MQAFDLHAYCDEFLGDLRHFLAGSIDDLGGEAASYLTSLITVGGQGFRTRLMIEAVFARTGHADRGAVLRLAASVELLHLASLIHDDYVDGASHRRGLPTVRAAVGDEATLLLGTSTALRAARIAHEVGFGFARVLADGAAGLADGQLSDLQRPFGTSMAVEEYIRILRKKTGSLTAMALLFGAAVGSPLGRHEPELLKCLGEELGVIFQIADDLNDVVGCNVGKPTGLDSQNGLTLDAIIRSDGSTMTPATLRTFALDELDSAAAAWMEIFAEPPVDTGVFGVLRQRLEGR